MIFIVAPIVAITICTLHYLINERPFEKAEPLEPPQPFVVSEYYDRMEKAALNIMEVQEPIDQIISGSALLLPKPYVPTLGIL